MGMWNPWRGCHKISDGCKYCYIHTGDLKRGIDTNVVTKTDRFDAPIAKTAKGVYKMKAGQMVYVCFSSDFLIEDADDWRGECWEMMKARRDLSFLFLTKRIERFAAAMPPDWGEGYENVSVGCTVENQKNANARLEIFDTLPIKHKHIICQPLLEPIDITRHLSGVECVTVGGEYGQNARTLDYDWVLGLRAQCVAAKVSFQFRQCATHFIKDGKTYRLKYKDLSVQAKKARIDFNPVSEKKSDG